MQNNDKGDAIVTVQISNNPYWCSCCNSRPNIKEVYAAGVPYTECTRCGSLVMSEIAYETFKVVRLDTTRYLSYEAAVHTAIRDVKSTKDIRARLKRK